MPRLCDVCGAPSKVVCSSCRDMNYCKPPCTCRSNLPASNAANALTTSAAWTWTWDRTPPMRRRFLDHRLLLDATNRARAGRERNTRSAAASEEASLHALLLSRVINIPLCILFKECVGELAACKTLASAALCKLRRRRRTAGQGLLLFR